MILFLSSLDWGIPCLEYKMFNQSTYEDERVDTLAEVKIRRSEYFVLTKSSESGENTLGILIVTSVVYGVEPYESF